MKHFFLGAMLCFGWTMLAQDEAFIKKAGDDACPCTHKISVEQPREKIIEEINTCIASSTIMAQMSGIDFKAEAENALKKEKTAADTTKLVYTIVADKNFDEIQAYMFETCEAVKYLMAVNNDKLSKSITKNKKALAFYEEGQGYSAREEHNMAVVSYNKAVKADPKFVFAWDNLGMSYRKMGNYKEAIKCYQKSLDIEPRGIMPLQNMAVAYEYLKDNKSAGETYEKLISLYPNDPEGFYGAARSYYATENYEKAADYIFKAYLLYSKQKSPYVNDAMTLIRSYYADLKEKNKLNILLKAAENNKIDLKD
jgi:tetratricopeptide (TPR) repeat protein